MGAMVVPEVRGMQKMEAVTKNVMEVAGALGAGREELIDLLLVLAVAVLPPWPLLRVHVVSEAMAEAWLDQMLAAASSWDGHYRT